MSLARLVPEKTALLVVDVQERLASVMQGTSAVTNIAKLIDGARALELAIVVTEQYPKGLGPTLASLREKLPENASVLEKLDFDACDDPQIASHLDGLAARGIRAIVLTGMEAHICVAQTARGLVDRGFVVHVAADATASRAAGDRSIAEGLWGRAGAIVTSTETVLFDLVKRAQGDRFKAVSKIVR